MPELPEVETVRRDLAGQVAGDRIDAVWTSGKPLRLLRPMPEADLVAACEGRRLLGVRRRAKVLLLDVEGGAVIVVHLGMSGQLTVAPAGARRPVHTHVVWRLAGGRELRFVDVRRFGFVDVTRTGAEDEVPELAHLGLDPLDAGFTAAALRARLGQTRRYIKLALLDQRVVGGLGNIYTSEALFEARVHPAARANRLSLPRVERLREGIVNVLERAIENRGTTLRDYRDGRGEPGRNQAALRVYGREGEACPRRDGGRIRRVVTQARSTFYCPTCQRV